MLPPETLTIFAALLLAISAIVLTAVLGRLLLTYLNDYEEE